MRKIADIKREVWEQELEQLEKAIAQAEQVEKVMLLTPDGEIVGEKDLGKFAGGTGKQSIKKEENLKDAQDYLKKARRKESALKALLGL